METWKTIKGFKGRYKISNLGRVRSCARLKIAKRPYGKVKIKHKQRILKPKVAKSGYYEIGLYSATSARKNFSIHRLAALAFVPNTKKFKQVNHIDFDLENNSASNLEWCTAKQNHEHSAKAGRMKNFYASQMGEKNKNSKLKVSDIVEIRKRYDAGESQLSLCAEFKVNGATMNAVVHRKAWKHIKDKKGSKYAK